MVVENGTGFENSDSYVDLDFANNYFSARGNEAWTSLTDYQKEYALVCATDYVDTTYDWNGVKKNYKQALRFPREKLVDIDGYKVEGIPVNLKQAVCECAVKISQKVEMFQTVEANGAITSERIGELSFSYDTAQRVKDKSLYDVINLRLRGLFKDKSSQKIVIGEYSK